MIMIGAFAVGVTHIDANGYSWSANLKGWTQHRQLAVVGMSTESSEKRNVTD